jgi:hypothetical protein
MCLGGLRHHLFGRGVVREDLAVDAALTDAARDELAVLGPEIEDQDRIVFHRGTSSPPRRNVRLWFNRRDTKQGES